MALASAPISFPVLCDPDLAVINRYGVFHVDEPHGYIAARPAVFIIDEWGIVRYCHVGEHSRDRPAIGTLLLALESLF